jgi:sigma-B regulation protein RsbU (phosphoserine phosphatase)
MAYRQGRVAFEPGDLLVLYSDGILEAEDPAGEQFGEERLQRIITQNLRLPCLQIRELILEGVRSFAHTSELQDDLTLVLVRAGIASITGD